MKIPFAVQLDTEVAASLRTAAADVGATIGDLTSLCVRFTLEKLPREKLRQWAQAQPSRVGRPPGASGALTKVERAALTAFDALKVQPHAGKVFSVVELARAAGLPVRDAYSVIPALEGRGRVKSAASKDLDRWGRPSEVVAWLESDGFEGVDQAVVLDAVASLRAELALLRVEPLAVGMIERKCRLTAGWSPAALRLPQGESSETYDVTGEGAVEWLRARWPVAV